MHRLPRAPWAANFDAAGDQLVTVDAGALRFYRLDRRARPELVASWSMKPLLAQIAPPDLALDDVGLDLDRLMAHAGTTKILAESDPAALTEALWLDEAALPAVGRLVAQAARPNRATHLTPLKR